MAPFAALSRLSATLLGAGLLFAAAPLAAHANPSGAGIDCQVFADPMNCYTGGDHVAGADGSTSTSGQTGTVCLGTTFDSTNNTLVRDNEIVGVFSGYDADTGFALINLSGRFNNTSCANDLVATGAAWVYWLNNPIVQARSVNGGMRVEVGF